MGYNAMAEELADLNSLMSLILPLDMILNQCIYFPVLRCLYHDSIIIISYHPLSAFQVDIFKEFSSLQFCTHSFHITQRAELITAS